MPFMLHSRTADLLWADWDEREVALRRVVSDRLIEAAPPDVDAAVVASYFLALRSQTLAQAAVEISYHATSGTRNPPPGSLLAACSARLVGVDPFDSSGRLGLVHIAFPLKMLLQPDGHLTSADVLHTLAAAIIFDVYENQDARLVAVRLPASVMETFPGPAHGPSGIRTLTGLGPSQPAFGTILKPTAGITPDDVSALVGEVASCALFVFVKEDEDLYPNLDYSPVDSRTRAAVAAIATARLADAPGLLFAPHISGAPHEIVHTAQAALDAGATALMFSETWTGGTVRMVREMTRGSSRPPAIYGHNAGIGTRTRAVWREVIDLFARLDGIDFRQTSPVRPGDPFLRPYGAEWRASEEILTRPLGRIRPTTIVRAGSLDQGNIGLNLQDVEDRGLTEMALFLAGSAINSVKDRTGHASPALGAEAMLQAIDVHRAGDLREVEAPRHVEELYVLARTRKLDALAQVLPQRYPELGR